MKRVPAATFSLLIIFSATIFVFAKGTTTKVTITSAELQSPIEIRAIQRFSRTATFTSSTAVTLDSGARVREEVGLDRDEPSSCQIESAAIVNLLDSDECRDKGHAIVFTIIACSICLAG